MAAMLRGQAGQHATMYYDAFDARMPKASTYKHGGGCISNANPSLCLRCGAGDRRRCCGQRQRQRLAALCAAGSNGKGPVVVIDNYDSFTYNLCQVWFLCGALCKHSPLHPVPCVLRPSWPTLLALRGRARVLTVQCCTAVPGRSRL